MSSCFNLLFLFESIIKSFSFRAILSAMICLNYFSLLILRIIQLYWHCFECRMTCYLHVTTSNDYQCWICQLHLIIISFLSTFDFQSLWHHSKLFFILLDWPHPCWLLKAPYLCLQLWSMGSLKTWLKARQGLDHLFTVCIQPLRPRLECHITFIFWWYTAFRSGPPHSKQ